MTTDDTKLLSQLIERRCAALTQLRDLARKQSA